MFHEDSRDMGDSPCQGGLDNTIERRPLSELNTHSQRNFTTPTKFSRNSYSSLDDPFNNPLDKKKSYEFVIKSPLNLSITNNTPAHELSLSHDFSPAQIFKEETYGEFDIDEGKEVNKNILNETMDYGDESFDSQPEYTHRHRALLSDALSKMNVSPGNYFAKKSCHLGHLDGLGPTSQRPFFKTPARDRSGDIIDYLATPFYDKENHDYLPKHTSSKDRYNYLLPETPAHLRSKPVVEQDISPLVEPVLIPTTRMYSINLPSRNTNYDSTNLTIRFDNIPYIEKTTTTLCLTNQTTSPSLFTIHANLKARVETKTKSHLIQTEVFIFEKLKGSVEGKGQAVFDIQFKPVVAGKYKQTFLLRCNGKVVSLNLMGEAYSRVDQNHRDKTKSSKTEEKHGLKSDNILKKEHKEKEGVKNFKERAVKNEQPLRKPQVLHASNEPAIKKQPLDSTKTIRFDCISIGRSQTLELRVENPKRIHCVFEIYVTAPFHVPASKVPVQASCYLNLPIAFRPTRVGDYSAFVVVRFGSETFKVRCVGSCKRNQ